MEISQRLLVGLALLVFIAAFSQVNAQTSLVLTTSGPIPLARINGIVSDLSPNYVEVLSDDPRKSASDHFSVSGSTLENIAGSPKYVLTDQGVPHIYSTPDEYSKAHVGHPFKSGDVIFKFWLSSAQDVNAFIRRLNPKVACKDVKLCGRPLVLYSVAPDRYLICSVPLTDTDATIKEEAPNQEDAIQADVAEQRHPPESAVEPISNGQSSPPTR